MKRVCFVILHYKAMQDTMACMDSVQEAAKGISYEMIVVDNHSGDGSIKQLKKKYEGQGNVHFLENAANLGFARGNNVGYSYAKEHFHPDFIVVLNNDTEMTDKQFVSTMYALYEEEAYYVLGPDIVNLDGEHQNPHREAVLTAADLRKMVFRKRIFQFYLYMKKLFHLEDKIRILEVWDEKNTKRRRENKLTTKARTGVVLQGSCFVFSPLYLKTHKQAFCPHTFLYLEEEILSYECEQRGYKVLFSPKLCILHKEQRSTHEIMTNDGDRRLFSIRHFLESAKVLRKLMKEERRRKQDET